MRTEQNDGDGDAVEEAGVVEEGAVILRIRPQHQQRTFDRMPTAIHPMSCSIRPTCSIATRQKMSRTAMRAEEVHDDQATYPRGRKRSASLSMPTSVAEAPAAVVEETADVADAADEEEVVVADDVHGRTGLMAATGLRVAADR